MKIFWSWQSDHPGKISRHFVKDALETAINELNAEATIDEPERELSLDHDRKGVPGSPDLARTILDKIENCTVLVADVTPVGETSDKPPKKLINSNVAIELGFGLGTVGDSALLMVMNTHYGRIEDLPFDLRHNAGPVTYALAPGASTQVMKEAKSELVGKLKAALREMLATARPATDSHHQETLPFSVDDPSRYFDGELALASRNGNGFFVSPFQPLVYLRLIPICEAPTLKRAEALELIRRGPVHLEPLAYSWHSSSFEQNKFGALAFDYEEGEISHASQLFRNRELWGIDGDLLRPRTDELVVPIGAVEVTLTQGLRNYLAFARDKLGFEPPVIVEAGMTYVEGYQVALPREFDPYGVTGRWGPIHQEHVTCRTVLRSFQSADIDAVLLEIFEEFFDSVGKLRPPGFNNFPAGGK